MKTLKKVCSNIYLVFIFVLLYAPILTLMVLSFNQSKSRARWGGFTTRWYTELFQNEEILLAFRNTMVIAFLSALVATLIGLCACMAMNNMKKRWRSLFMGIANIPMLNAEIVTGISLMLVFLKLRPGTGQQFRKLCPVLCQKYWKLLTKRCRLVFRMLPVPDFLSFF